MVIGHSTVRSHLLNFMAQRLTYAASVVSTRLPYWPTVTVSDDPCETHTVVVTPLPTSSGSYAATNPSASTHTLPYPPPLPSVSSLSGGLTVVTSNSVLPPTSSASTPYNPPSTSRSLVSTTGSISLAPSTLPATSVSIPVSVS